MHLKIKLYTIFVTVLDREKIIFGKNCILFVFRYNFLFT